MIIPSDDIYLRLELINNFAVSLSKLYDAYDVVCYHRGCKINN